MPSSNLDIVINAIDNTQSTIDNITTSIKHDFGNSLKGIRETLDKSTASIDKMAEVFKQISVLDIKHLTTLSKISKKTDEICNSARGIAKNTEQNVENVRKAETLIIKITTKLKEHINVEKQRSKLLKINTVAGEKFEESIKKVKEHLSTVNGKFGKIKDSLKQKIEPSFGKIKSSITDMGKSAHTFGEKIKSSGKPIQNMMKDISMIAAEIPVCNNLMRVFNIICAANPLGVVVAAVAAIVAGLTAIGFKIADVYKNIKETTRTISIYNQLTESNKHQLESIRNIYHENEKYSEGEVKKAQEIGEALEVIKTARGEINEEEIRAKSYLSGFSDKEIQDAIRINNVRKECTNLTEMEVEYIKKLDEAEKENVKWSAEEKKQREQTYYVMQHLSEEQKKMGDIIDHIASALGGVFAQALARIMYVMDKIGMVWDAITSAIKKAAENIINFFKPALDIVGGIVGKIGEIFDRLTGGAFSSAGNIIENIGNDYDNWYKSNIDTGYHMSEDDKKEKRKLSSDLSSNHGYTSYNDYNKQYIGSNIPNISNKSYYNDYERIAAGTSTGNAYTTALNNYANTIGSIAPDNNNAQNQPLDKINTDINKNHDILKTSIDMINNNYKQNSDDILMVLNKIDTNITANHQTTLDNISNNTQNVVTSIATLSFSMNKLSEQFGVNKIIDPVNKILGGVNIIYKTINVCAYMLNKSITGAINSLSSTMQSAMESIKYAVMAAAQAAQAASAAAAQAAQTTTIGGVDISGASYAGPTQPGYYPAPTPFGSGTKKSTNNVTLSLKQAPIKKSNYTIVSKSGGKTFTRGNIKVNK